MTTMFHLHAEWDEKTFMLHRLSARRGYSNISKMYGSCGNYLVYSTWPNLTVSVHRDMLTWITLALFNITITGSDFELETSCRASEELQKVQLSKYNSAFNHCIIELFVQNICESASHMTWILVRITEGGGPKWKHMRQMEKVQTLTWIREVHLLWLGPDGRNTEHQQRCEA